MNVKPDSITRAEELLKLITSPTGIATVILLGFARSQLDRNAEGYERTRTLFGLTAAVGAILITVSIVVVMLPLAIRVLVTNDGGVETVLLVYILTFFVAVGTAAYAIKVALDCLRELRP